MVQKKKGRIKMGRVSELQIREAIANFNFTGRRKTAGLLEAGISTTHICSHLRSATWGI